MTTHTYPEIKRVGETGQVSVGKALAGKLVRVEPTDDGVMLRFVTDVAESEAWWLHEPYKSKLKEALAWAKTNPAAETDLNALLARAKSASSRAPAKKRAPTKKSTKK